MVRKVHGFRLSFGWAMQALAAQRAARQRRGDAR